MTLAPSSLFGALAAVPAVTDDWLCSEVKTLHNRDVAQTDKECESFDKLQACRAFGVAHVILMGLGTLFLVAMADFFRLMKTSAMVALGLGGTSVCVGVGLPRLPRPVPGVCGCRRATIAAVLI